MEGTSGSERNGRTGRGGTNGGNQTCMILGRAETGMIHEGKSPAPSHASLMDPGPSWSLLRHFQLLAKLNEWTEKEKGMYRRVSLLGSVLKILEMVDAFTPHGYDCLLVTLEHQYQPPDRVSLYRTQLRAKHQFTQELLGLGLWWSVLYDWPTLTLARMWRMTWGMTSSWQGSETRSSGSGSTRPIPRILLRHVLPPSRERLASGWRKIRGWYDR